MYKRYFGFTEIGLVFRTGLQYCWTMEDFVNRQHYRQQLRQKKILLGLCSRCANSVVTGKRFCADHLNKQQQRRDAKANLQQCLDCSAPVVPSTRYCSDHTAARNQQRKEKNAAQVCRQCSEPSVKSHLCQQHYEDHKRYNRTLYQNRRAEGKCYSCGEPSVLGKTLCDDHLRKNREYQRKRQELLKQ